MQSVFELLLNVSLLAKTVSADAEHIDFFLNQLEDPENYRPLKSLTDQHDREMYCDPRDGHWQQRFFCKPREHHIIAERKDAHYKKKFTWSGHPKNTQYTKKTSVTLLPPHAKMQFYQPKASHKNAIGFLFHINRCDLKDKKYIFPKMANTDKRWWLYNSQTKHLIQKSISLETLRKQLCNASKNNQILPPNELLVGLSRAALVGIFSPVDSRASRLQALIAQQKIQKRFKINLPIFVITINGMHVYSERRQKDDILESEILNDHLFLELLTHCDPILLETKSTPSFQLENLFKKDSGTSKHILSFLTLPELALLSQTNNFMRSLLNDNSNAFLWHNLVSKKTIIKDNLSNKHDIGLYYEIILRPGGLSLENFARTSQNRSYRIMQSQFFSQRLPSAERRLRSIFRSNFQKIIEAFLGFFIGLFIGLVMTVPLAILALLRTIGFLGIIGFFFKTSLARSLLGTTVFPLFSLCKSSWYGAMFGWKYGLRQLNYLIDGLGIFHLELYHGTKENGSHDPWECLTSYEQSIAYSEDTDIWKFFEMEHGLKTIAEIAIEIHAQKPRSLMYLAPQVISYDPIASSTETVRAPFDAKIMAAENNFEKSSEETSISPRM
jgi:hypothetical protein